MGKVNDFSTSPLSMMRVGRGNGRFPFLLTLIKEVGDVENSLGFPPPPTTPLKGKTH